MADFKPGDRVEYPDYMRAQLGAERFNQQGVVIDVIEGVAGKVAMVFSLPDEAFNVLEGGDELKIDFVLTGKPSRIRKLK